jgi:hypothetical protein
VLSLYIYNYIYTWETSEDEQFSTTQSFWANGDIYIYNYRNIITHQLNIYILFCVSRSGNVLDPGCEFQEFLVENGRIMFTSPTQRNFAGPVPPQAAEAVDVVGKDNWKPSVMEGRRCGVVGNSEV